MLAGIEWVTGTKAIGRTDLLNACPTLRGKI